MKQEKILIGKTKKKAKIYVCNNCQCFNIPHFIYDTKKYAISINILEAKYTDFCRSIDLSSKNDLEIFLNSNNNKYNMTNWEVVKKIWNEHNEQQLPKYCHKPYYRNLVEDVDYFNISLQDRDERLDGGRIYCNEDSEKEPHFHYRLKDGADVVILFKEAEYMYPLERLLTNKEIDNLITFLKGTTKSEYGEENNWETAIFAWNNENYKANSHNNGIFPYYEKLQEDLPMPDYTKLKEEQYV